MSQQRPLPSIHEKLQNVAPLDYGGMGERMRSLPPVHESHNSTNSDIKTSPTELTSRILQQYKYLQRYFTKTTPANKQLALLPLFGFTENEITHIVNGENVTQETPSPQNKHSQAPIPTGSVPKNSKEDNSIVFIDCNNMKSNYRTRQTHFGPPSKGKILGESSPTTMPLEPHGGSSYNPLPQENTCRESPNLFI